MATPHPDLAWLQPYPDALIAPRDEEPDRRLVARETVELAFIVAIQLLPPLQRAALIIRDVLGFSAQDTAAALDTSVPSANSALQRARATLRRQLPQGRLEWAPPSEPTPEERELVHRYADAYDRRDFAEVASLLRDDVRLTMPPTPSWFQGAAAITTLLRAWTDPGSDRYVGDVRRLPTGANLQPAFAGYLRLPDEDAYRPLGLEVLRVEHGQVAEITMFVSTEIFAAFGLPATL